MSRYASGLGKEKFSRFETSGKLKIDFIQTLNWN